MFVSPRGAVGIWGGVDTVDYPTDVKEFNLETMEWQDCHMNIEGTLREPPMPVQLSTLTADMELLLCCHLKFSFPYLMEATESVRPSEHRGIPPADELCVRVSGVELVLSRFLLACRSKQYFGAMLNSKFAESTHASVDLPDTQLATFLFILYYLYCGDVCLPIMDPFSGLTDFIPEHYTSNSARDDAKQQEVFQVRGEGADTTPSAGYKHLQCLQSRSNPVHKIIKNILRQESERNPATKRVRYLRADDAVWLHDVQ